MGPVDPLNAGQGVAGMLDQDATGLGKQAASGLWALPMRTQAISVRKAGWPAGGCAAPRCRQAQRGRRPLAWPVAGSSPLRGRLGTDATSPAEARGGEQTL